MKEPKFKVGQVVYILCRCAYDYQIEASIYKKTIEEIHFKKEGIKYYPGEVFEYPTDETFDEEKIFATIEEVLAEAKKHLTKQLLCEK